MKRSALPQRGEIWRAQLEPVQGSEQGKTRPVVVLSEPTVGRATVVLCAPLVHAKPEHGGFFWCVALVPEAVNGLSKPSTADAAQVRALDTARLQARLGELAPDEVDLIAEALCHCVKRSPSAVSSSATLSGE